ncbi:SHOCT domain-containing protein [Modicisalibacter ilicicola]|nr:SHOCT domain-containing protein [Halomonas ilicicola]
MNGYGWDMVGFGLLHMALFWGLIGAAIVILVRAARGDREGVAVPSKLTRLEERYARGEIDRGEFERGKLDIER